MSGICCVERQRLSKSFSFNLACNTMEDRLADRLVLCWAFRASWIMNDLLHSVFLLVFVQVQRTCRKARRHWSALLYPISSPGKTSFTRGAWNYTPFLNPQPEIWKKMYCTKYKAYLFDKKKLRTKKKGCVLKLGWHCEPLNPLHVHVNASPCVGANIPWKFVYFWCQKHWRAVQALKTCFFLAFYCLDPPLEKR